MRSAVVRVISCCRVLLFACSACIGNATANDDWIPTFVSSPEEQRTPSEPIQIILPPEVGSETLQWLALEIDDIDVSQIVQLVESPQGLTIVVEQVQPLGFGEHRVRLVQYTPEGDILERGAWTFEIRQSERFREASFNSNLTLDPSYRISEDELAEDIDRLQGNGSLVVNGRVSDEGWEAEGSASFLYNSEGVQLEPDVQDEMDAEVPVEMDTTTLANPSGGDDIDLGEYLLTHRTATQEAQLGDHAIGYQSLILDDFYRRGASFSKGTTSGSVTGTGFAMRTEPIAGHENLLGNTNHESRVAGGVISGRPLANKDALTLTAAALSGEGTDESGEALAGNNDRTEGDAYSLAAESLLANERLRLRGEYAKTDYDFDGVEGEFEKIDDDATAVLAEFTPWTDKTIKDKPATLNLGAEYQKIGLFFKSIANNFLPPDKELRRVYSDFNWSGLTVSASVGDEKDNVDDAPDLPKLRTELSGVAVS
ncbi:MAG: hypothetical protein OES09_17735, partial [Gammaproteobacteria bacterium]|nr:hypothetical protein [Gammaproteobacteria bacterium]